MYPSSKFAMVEAYGPKMMFSLTKIHNTKTHILPISPPESDTTSEPGEFAWRYKNGLVFLGASKNLPLFGREGVQDTQDLTQRLEKLASDAAAGGFYLRCPQAERW